VKQLSHVQRVEGALSDGIRLCFQQIMDGSAHLTNPIAKRHECSSKLEKKIVRGYFTNDDIFKSDQQLQWIYSLNSTPKRKHISGL